MNSNDHSSQAPLSTNGTNGSSNSEPKPDSKLTIDPRPAKKYELEIHEFSTGIKPTGNYQSWISQGFASTYMNVTIDPIPNIVEIAIANGLFTTSGGHPSRPVIIGRVLQGKDEQWSVVALVTIGEDDKGRNFSAFRFFLAEGIDSISAIATWLEECRQSNNLPIFNPYDIRQVGQPHKLTIEIPESIPLTPADLTRLNEPKASITKPTDKLSLREINDLAHAKSQLNHKPITWAYNVYSLKSPEKFQIIHPINDASQLAIQNTINNLDSSNKQSPSPLLTSDERLDPKVLLKNLIGQSIPSENLVIDLLEQIKERSTFRSNFSSVDQGDVSNTNDVNRRYWDDIFESFDAKKVLFQNLYLPNMVRLLTWKAIVFPETLPELLNWLQAGDNSNQITKNQETFLDLEEGLKPHIEKIKENLILGLLELPINLFLQQDPESNNQSASSGKRSVPNFAWILDNNLSDKRLWASLKDEVIKILKERLLLSVRDNKDASQAWQDSIQSTIQTSNSTAVSNTLLEEPKDWQVFYDGIRNYVTTKQNNKQYHYVAKFFEQLASGKKKNSWSGLTEFALGVRQVIIFIAAIIFVIVFNNFFAANIAKEISLSVSMFLPLTWLAIVSLITQSFIATWGLGILHIVLSRLQLCLQNPQGIAATLFWSIAILIIGVIYASRSSSNKNGNVNRDAYALAAVFYTISDGTVSQDVFENAPKLIQGFRISSARTIDRFLIGFGKVLIKAMQKAWKKDKLSFIIIVVLVFAIGWIGDKALGSYGLPNLSGLISYSNPNCFDPVPRGDWATTRLEIKQIVDERVSAGNRPSLVITELLNVLGVTEQGAFPGQGGYSYVATIDNQGTNQIIIQRWQDRIREYQTNRRQQHQDIVVSGYLTSGDRTSQLLRADLVARLTPQPTPTPSATPSPRPSATPSPNGNVTINQAEIQRMFDEIQQTIDGTSRSAERPAIATQQRILKAIQDKVPKPKTGEPEEPLRFPLITRQDEINWRYDIKRAIIKNDTGDITLQQWQDFKNRVKDKAKN